MHWGGVAHDRAFTINRALSVFHKSMSSMKCQLKPKAIDISGSIIL